MVLRSLIAALIRILALIYFVRTFDQILGASFLLAQQAINPQTPLPTAYILGFAVVAGLDLLLAIGLFVGAPRLAKFFLPGELPADKSAVPVNEVLLFCTGVIMGGWAFIRLVDAAENWIVASLAQHALASFERLNPAQFASALVVMLASIVLCSRFSSIYQWIKSRSRG